MSKLKFSPNTLSVLENFASLNPACCLEEGNVIRTTNPAKSVLAIVKINETIPTDFRVYNLPGLISILKMPLFKECDINIDSKCMIIENEKASQQFWAAADSLVKLPPVGFSPNLDEEKFSGSLTSEDLSHILKVIGSMKHDLIEIRAQDGKLKLISKTKADRDTSNTHEVNIGMTTADDYQILIAPELLKLIHVDYNFKVGTKGNGDAIIFTSQDQDETITYFIGGSEVED